MFYNFANTINFVYNIKQPGETINAKSLQIQ